MLFFTRWFGVTGSDAERRLANEQAVIDEITERVLVVQSKAAAQQKQPLRRGTHAKGICVRAQFEVFDVSSGRDIALARRLAKGIFAKPGIYPATVRFANADSKVNSDFKPDVRSLSFSVDLTQGGKVDSEFEVSRQDFSLQNAKYLPINDSAGFLAIMKVLSASNPGAGLWHLSFKDKLRVIRTIALTKLLEQQPIKPYQQLRYWSNVPFRHGPIEAVQYSAISSPDNAAHSLQRKNPNGLQDELIRHLHEDAMMSSFDFAVQFLDAEKMTYWGKRRDASFWIENASVEWNETQAPFHRVARLTLLSNSNLSQETGEIISFDVTGNSTKDSFPVGSINRARQRGDLSSAKARMR